MSLDLKQQISHLVCEGRERLNAGERLRSGAWALFAFGVFALFFELSYLLRGHRVALPILLLPLLLAGSVALVRYLRFRYSHRKAVGHMDRVFDLKEGLITADEHIREGRDDEIHRLQLQHTRDGLAPHDHTGLRGAFPVRLFSVSLLIAAVAIGLLFVDDSLAVKQARAESEAVLALSEALVEELEEAFENVLEEMDEEAAELLKDPALKEMIDTFEAGGDRRAVMRKLSEIDSRLARMQSELDTRADENYLMELAEQLRQSQETRALGEALSQRNYRQAAEALENMKLGENASADRREALEKLAARIGETEKSMSSSQSGSRRNAQEMSKQIKKMAQEQKKSGQCSSESRSGVNKSMSKNGKSMKQLGARKKAQSGLEQLRKKLKQQQQACAGSGGTGQKPSGKGAGEGIDRSFRPPGMESPATGRQEQLSGQLGEGESETQIEETASGSGTASGGGLEKAAAGYQQQLEAFVRREDVPEEMKHGVKTYFKQIHTLENTESGGVE